MFVGSNSTEPHYIFPRHHIWLWNNPNGCCDLASQTRWILCHSSLAHNFFSVRTSARGRYQEVKSQITEHSASLRTLSVQAMIDCLISLLSLAVTKTKGWKISTVLWLIHISTYISNVCVIWFHLSPGSQVGETFSDRNVNIVVSSSLSACYCLLQKLHPTPKLLSRFRLMSFSLCCSLDFYTFISFPEQAPIFLPKDTVVLVSEDRSRVLKNGQILFM